MWYSCEDIVLSVCMHVVFLVLSVCMHVVLSVRLVCFSADITEMRGQKMHKETCAICDALNATRCEMPGRDVSNEMQDAGHIA